jgi:predicted RNase H-like HicB family nuclease
LGQSRKRIASGICISIFIRTYPSPSLTLPFKTTDEMINQLFTAHIYKHAEGYHAECIELGVNAQGPTVDSALENLKLATEKDLLETENTFILPAYPIVIQYTITLNNIKNKKKPKVKKLPPTPNSQKQARTSG